MSVGEIFPLPSLVNPTAAPSGAAVLLCSWQGAAARALSGALRCRHCLSLLGPGLLACGRSCTLYSFPEPSWLCNRGFRWRMIASLPLQVCRCPGCQAFFAALARSFVWHAIHCAEQVLSSSSVKQAGTQMLEVAAMPVMPHSCATDFTFQRTHLCRNFLLPQ